MACKHLVQLLRADRCAAQQLYYVTAIADTRSTTTTATIAVVIDTLLLLRPLHKPSTTYMLQTCEDAHKASAV
jgi:hypothetical protein